MLKFSQIWLAWLKIFVRPQNLNSQILNKCKRLSMPTNTTGLKTRRYACHLAAFYLAQLLLTSHNLFHTSSWRYSKETFVMTNGMLWHNLSSLDSVWYNHRWCAHVSQSLFKLSKTRQKTYHLGNYWLWL